MDESGDKQREEVERHFETVVCYLGVRHGWGEKTHAEWMRHAKEHHFAEREKK